MTSVDNNEPERGSDDIVAAEYVLGVLPAAERTAAARRIDLRAGVRAPCRAMGRLFRAAGRGLPGGRAAGLGEARARSPAVCNRRRGAKHAASSPASGRASRFWRGLAAAAIAALRASISRCPNQSAGRASADPAGRITRARRQRRQLPRRLRCRDWRGGAVACLRRARQRPRLRAVDGRGPECAGFDGRHPGRRIGTLRSRRRSRPSSTRASRLPSASSRRAVRPTASPRRSWLSAL